LRALEGKEKLNLIKAAGQISGFRQSRELASRQICRVIKLLILMTALKRWTPRILRDAVRANYTTHTLKHITNSHIYIFALPVSYWFESQINELPVGHACRPESGHPL